MSVLRRYVHVLAGSARSPVRPAPPPPALSIRIQPELLSIGFTTNPHTGRSTRYNVRLHSSCTTSAVLGADDSLVSLTRMKNSSSLIVRAALRTVVPRDETDAVTPVAATSTVSLGCPASMTRLCRSGRMESRSSWVASRVPERLSSNHWRSPC